MWKNNEQLSQELDQVRKNGREGKSEAQNPSPIPRPSLQFPSSLFTLSSSLPHWVGLLLLCRSPICRSLLSPFSIFLISRVGLFHSQLAAQSRSPPPLFHL